MEILASDQLKVLVVDDDELNQRMMRLILTREGHLVHIACDGLDALRVVDAHEFDIILMDLQMPNMGGVEASRRIRESESASKNAYIVALTASYLPEKGQELFDAGIDNYIAKPFDVEHLRQMLDYGLGHRRLRKFSDVYSVNNPIGTAVSPGFDARTGIIMVGGDGEIYRELLLDFVEQLPEKNISIEKFLNENDMVGLSRLAHNIKGVSSNLGALQLSEYAGKLEKFASDGYTTELLVNTAREVRDISEKFIEDASKFLASTKEK